MGLRILVGFLTGHCPLNKHLHNMGPIDEPICIVCEMEDESAFCFLMYLPKSDISKTAHIFETDSER
jgi:hypothetical protein